MLFFFSISECQNYGSLNSGDRKITYSSYQDYCDSRLGPRWFRFEGSAGIRMATSCPPTRRCRTDATGWLNGGHPTVADGQVSRTVCFHWSGSCCNWSTNSKHQSEKLWFIFSDTPGRHCSLRYCGTN